MNDTNPNPTTKRMLETMQRLGFNHHQAAAYLGVHVTTYTKWLNGERQPGAAIERLIDVLNMLEALSPELHSSLVPALGAQKPRGRPRKDAQ